jgi:hypothetical protein
MCILNIPSPENAGFRSIPICAAWHSFFSSATATNGSAPFSDLRRFRNCRETLNTHQSKTEI